MGETDYKDEDWTEKDFEELHKAALEGQRKREELYGKDRECKEHPEPSSI